MSIVLYSYKYSTILIDLDGCLEEKDREDSGNSMEVFGKTPSRFPPQRRAEGWFMRCFHVSCLFMSVIPEVDFVEMAIFVEVTSFNWGVSISSY